MRINPFSTRQTCGACHDYERITSGYHFTSRVGIASGMISPRKSPWVLSDGMMGKQ